MADHSAFFSTYRHLLRLGDLTTARVANPAWEQASLRVLIARLSPYGDVDRSTTHLFLAQEARRGGSGVFVDFCFFPAREDAALLAAYGVPPLVGVASSRSVEDFDLVLVSCSFVPELLNLPALLERSGLPVMAGDRPAGPAFVLGGSSALASQAVVSGSGDAMADAIFFGDGEGHVEHLARLFVEMRASGKRERLRRAAGEIAGLWLAGSTTVAVKAAVCPAPRARELVTEYPVLPGREAATARLQISYGCPFTCAFCFEGYGRKPYREVPAEELLAAAAELKRATGARSLELSSFNFNTHRDIMPLVLELNRLFAEVSLMSQRADILADTRGLLEAEMAAGKRTFTLGVEGVSERQRRFMDKRLDEGRLRRVLSDLLAAGAREAKLFYLLSGYETDEDFAELKAFLAWLRAEAEAKRNRTRIVFSFNRLIRMPFTPLAFDRLLLEQEQWQPAVSRARSAVTGAGYEFRLASSWPEYALCQTLALGGPWLCDALRELARDGHVYEGEARAETWEALRAWMAAHPDAVGAGFTAAKPADYGFPLGFVAAAVTQPALYARYLAAAAALAGDAPHVSPAAAAAPRRPVPDPLIRELRRVVREKTALAPLPARLRVPESAAGMGSEELAAWIARELMSFDAGLVNDLLDVRELALSRLAREQETFWAPSIPWYGESLFGLVAWRSERLLAALEGRASTPGGLALLGPAEAGASAPSHLRLRVRLADELFPQAGPRLADALNSAHAPVTALRDGGGWRLQPSAKARRALAAGTWRLADGVWCLDLSVGPRFPLLPYLRGFGRGLERRALVEVAGAQP